MKAVVLVSGGMDSVTALHQTHREHPVLAALSFDYGSKHNPREIPYAREHAAQLRIPHHTIALDFMGHLFASHLLRDGGAIPDGHYAEPSMKQTVVPFRNAIMLSIAAGFAESAGGDAVVIAAHAGDHAIYPDCREAFLQAMGSAMELGTYARIRLLRPFVHLDKAGIVALGHRLGIDYRRTWSCYKGGQLHCGTCGTCVERREAFQLAGIPDPTPYAPHPEAAPPQAPQA